MVTLEKLFQGRASQAIVAKTETVEEVHVMKIRTTATTVTRLYLSTKTAKNRSLQYVARIVVPKRKEQFQCTADTIEEAIAKARKKAGIRK
jgi:hypothetical protein